VRYFGTLDDVHGPEVQKIRNPDYIFGVPEFVFIGRVEDNEESL
jgi:hypothetical protein